MKYVYKLEGESYEIGETPVVYLNEMQAFEASKSWCAFLGVEDIQESYDNGDIRIVRLDVFS